MSIGNSLVEFLLHPQCDAVTGGTVAAEVVKGVMAGYIALTIFFPFPCAASHHAV
jgi:hypothetical protein